MRLIDADNFLERFEKMCETETDNIIATILRGALIDEPTAYSVDKVVEQLEKIRSKKTCNKEKCDTKELCRICVVDDAIEIVKQGSVSNDVCEWRLCDEVLEK